MNWSRHLLWTMPLLILIAQLPIFLQSNLTPDTVLYDLQAKCLLNGGVLYRDIVEPNLPGVVLVHALVRTCVGDSSVVLRLFDLAVLVGIAFVLQWFVCRAVSHQDSRLTARCVFVSLLLLFYLGTSEWCHCQRDTWMLLPCLVAMWLRTLTCERSAGIDHRTSDSFVAGQNQTSGHVSNCFVEGIFWAVGFWLKPFVAIPAIAVLGISCVFLPSAKIRVQQMFAVLIGGLCVGLAGMFWMVRAGCWIDFLDMMSGWNGDYFQAGRSRWTLDRYVAHAQRFFPWIVLHIPAIVIAGRTIFRVISSRRTPAKFEREDIAKVVLQAGYVGWLMQAFVFQQLFDYIHVPGIILAMAVCVQAAMSVLMTARTHDRLTTIQPSIGNLLLPLMAAFVAVAIVNSPTTNWARQRHWYRCLQACMGSVLEPEIKDDIALTPMPRWRELQPVIEKLHELCEDDTSVMAYNGNLIHLYSVMKLRPPTRFVYVDVLARCFPRRRHEILTAIEMSHVHYVVSDLIEDGCDVDLATNDVLPNTLALQSSTLFFPYNQTPVFRSGGYVIFEINRPIGWLTREYSPLSQEYLLQLTSTESSAAKE